MEPACAATETGDPSTAFIDAAIETAFRDELWRESPALEDGCDHDRVLLPIIEFRATVVCVNCGGLDKELSGKILREGQRLIWWPDGRIWDGTTLLARFELA